MSFFEADDEPYEEDQGNRDLDLPTDLVVKLAVMTIVLVLVFAR